LRCPDCGSRHVHIQTANPSRDYYVEQLVCSKCRAKTKLWDGNTAEMNKRKRSRKLLRKKMRAAARRLDSGGDADL